MTIGEFGKMVAAERKINVSLTVVPLEGLGPGPLVRRDGAALGESLTQHPLAHPGAAVLRRRACWRPPTCRSGGGPDSPFEVVGAPWIEPYGLVAALNDQRLPGVRFEPVVFTPTNERLRQYAVLRACGSSSPTARRSGRSRSGSRWAGRYANVIAEQFRPEGDPEPSGEPVHDVGFPAGRVAAASDGLGGDGARELPEPAGVVPHLLI